MENTHILVVHGELTVRQLVANSLGHDRVRVSFAASGAEGLFLLKKERVHVLVAGLDAQGTDYEFVRQAASIHPLLGVVLVVDKNLIDTAPQTARPGQIQFLAKPVTEDALRSAIHRALARRIGRDEARGPQKETAPASGNGHGEPLAATRRIIAASKAMREILGVVRRCAPTDAPVLICGEPDTGKELLAREIHRQSRRAAGPFIRVACGALRETELAERLVAPSGRRLDGGRQTPSSALTEARGGTLFLDNVGQLPLWSQTTLLDALQQDGGAPAADHREAKLDVRLIASSASDLQEAVARRTFSSSLYYFLNIVEIRVPPLRHRAQDIRPLAEMYLAVADSMRADREPCRFTDDAWHCLLEYDWPGNTLQLASVVAHAAILADGEEIGRAKIAEALGAVVPRSDSDTISVALAGGLKEIERAVIGAVIERCRGNKAAAARVLRLHRRTLYRILEDDAEEKKDGTPPPVAIAPSVAEFATAGYCPT